MCIRDRQSTSVSINLNTKTIHYVPLKPNSFKRAITNIINNASNYGKQIDIIVRKLPATIIIQIDDDGPGIPLKDREDVFKPFYRLDVARNPDTGGSGLGLTIARDVARAHGGDIFIEDSPKGGARINMRLPL